MRGSMFRIPTYRYWLAAVVTAIVVATFTLPWLLTSNVEGADEPTVLFQETAIGVSVGNSITVIVEASGIPVGTDGLQVEISHTAGFLSSSSTASDRLPPALPYPPPPHRLVQCSAARSLVETLLRSPVTSFL